MRVTGATFKDRQSNCIPVDRKEDRSTLSTRRKATCERAVPISASVDLEAAALT